MLKEQRFSYIGGSLLCIFTHPRPASVACGKLKPADLKRQFLYAA
ncbi:hypothetical protein MHB56_17685 [Paenibacillus sp. FSL H8-0315]